MSVPKQQWTLIAHKTGDSVHYVEDQFIYSFSMVFIGALIESDYGKSFIFIFNHRVCGEAYRSSIWWKLHICKCKFQVKLKNMQMTMLRKCFSFRKLKIKMSKINVQELLTLFILYNPLRENVNASVWVHNIISRTAILYTYWNNVL